MNGGSTFPNGSNLDLPPSGPGPSGHNGSGKDPFVVKVASPRKGSTDVTTSMGVTELDDGMAVVSSRPLNSGTTTLKLNDFSPQKEPPADTMISVHNCTVENIKSFSSNEPGVDDHNSKSELESVMNEEVHDNKKMSPPGVWASRIAPRKGFNALGPAGATSQSTPNTPTKSAGVSPNPTSRRMGSSSSSGSSNSRVKRSASATSRQEWKERMRKKHLPAIFVNTSFEEDNTDNAVIARPTSSQSSTLTTSQALIMHGVYEERSMKNKSEKTSHDTADKEDQDQYKEIEDKISKNPSVEGTYYASGGNTSAQVHALTARLQKKHSIADNEGMAGMYEDGDIDDILDEQITSFSSPLELESAHGREQVSELAVLRSLEDTSSASPGDQQLQHETQRERLISHESQTSHTDQGIDNLAFDMSTEASLPGSADIGVFYDDTVMSYASKASYNETLITSNTEGTDPSKLLLVTDTTTASSQATKNDIPQGIEAARSISTSEDTIVHDTSITTQHQVLTVTATSTNPSTTSTQISPASSLSHQKRYQQIMASSSGLLVSSVDEDDDHMFPLEDFKNPQNSTYVKVSSGSTDLQTSKASDELKPKASQISQVSTTSNLTSVSQDWGQLETVSGSEMLLFKTRNVKSASEVMLESSIDEEDGLDSRETNTGDGTDDEVSSDGGQRVDEKEWASNVPANLASFSTRENLSEVGHIYYKIGSYDLNSKFSSPSFERKVEGDGAECVDNKLPHASQNPLSVKSFISLSKDEDDRSNSDRRETNTKTVSEHTKESTQLTRRPADTVFNSYEQKDRPAPQNIDSSNSYLISQDSVSDSVFESDVENPKTSSIDSSIQSPKSDLSNTNITSATPPSKSVAKMDNFIQPNPTSVHTVIPKPFPSVTPTVPPTQKPPRGVRRRNREGVFARLTSSEDELDGIFDESDKQYNNLDLGFVSHSSKDNNAIEIFPPPNKEKKYKSIGGNLINDFDDSKNFTISEKSDTPDNLEVSGPVALGKEMASVGKNKGFSQVIVPLDHHHSSLGRDYSITLEPYGKRIPQWLEDTNTPYQDTFLLWDESLMDSQSHKEAYQRPGLTFGKENIVYVDKVPETTSLKIGERTEHGPQYDGDIQSVAAVETTAPSLPSEMEEYKLDSVDLTDDGDSRTVHRYQKNTRPSSSRPFKNNLTHKYNQHPPAPPPYSASHDSQTPSLELTPQSPLTQYHFDEDIDRGFEEALSIDYHSLALPSAPSSMNSLFVPSASFGLYFESISEEPEESLSLTEMAEASSLNGDNIFKTQAVISRPSSRASFTASIDNQQPENKLAIANMPGPDLDTSGSQTNPESHSGANSSSDRTVVKVKSTEYDTTEADFVPTSERTSADGSEAVEPIPGNGCHVPRNANDSYSSLPSESGNPWGFPESSSVLNEPSSSNAVSFDTFIQNDPFGQPVIISKHENDRESSPWLDLDIVMTNGSTGDNQLDMSFGSDFSSDHTLAESIDAEGYEISEYDGDQSKKYLEKKILLDSYTDFEREARPSTPHLSMEKTSLEFNDHVPSSKAAISRSEDGQNIASVYF